MAVVLSHSRTYDETFYRSLGPWGGDPIEAAARGSRRYEELFPE